MSSRPGARRRRASLLLRELVRTAQGRCLREVVSRGLSEGSVMRLGHLQGRESCDSLMMGILAGLIDIIGGKGGQELKRMSWFEIDMIVLVQAVAQADD